MYTQLTGQLFAITVIGTPGIIAALRDTPMLAGEHQAIGAIVQLRLIVNTLPVAIAIGDVAHNASFNLTWVLLVTLQLLTSRHIAGH